MLKTKPEVSSRGGGLMTFCTRESTGVANITNDTSQHTQHLRKKSSLTQFTVLFTQCLFGKINDLFLSYFQRGDSLFGSCVVN